LRVREGHPTLYEEFIQALDEAGRKKLVAAVARLASHGPPRNPEKCLALKGCSNLYELKEYQSRVFWFYGMQTLSDGRAVIVLTHGFTKKTRKTPQTQIDRAEALKQEYQERFLGGSR